jgi:hypothetical protein
MRTPPPVLPPENDQPAYRSSWYERMGADAPLRLRAAAFGLKVGATTTAALFLVALQGGVPSFAAILAFVVIGAIVTVVTTYMTAKLSDGAGAVAQSFIQPSGNSTPYEQTFSYQEAMIMRGDIAGALESYEAIIAEQPTLVAPRLRAAEHYARKNRNPARAAELLREIRDLPGTPVRDVLYASSRLVDLYDGPLADPGRAVVELRRIIERFPGSDLAKHARTALPALKARLAADQAS